MPLVMPRLAIFGRHLKEDSAVMHTYAILMRVGPGALNYNSDEMDGVPFWLREKKKGTLQ